MVTLDPVLVASPEVRRSSWYWHSQCSSATSCWSPSHSPPCLVLGLSFRQQASYCRISDAKFLPESNQHIIAKGARILFKSWNITMPHWGLCLLCSFVPSVIYNLQDFEIFLIVVQLRADYCWRYCCCGRRFLFLSPKELWLRIQY